MRHPGSGRHNTNPYFQVVIRNWSFVIRNSRPSPAGPRFSPFINNLLIVFDAIANWLFLRLYLTCIDHEMSCSQPAGTPTGR